MKEKLRQSSYFLRIRNFGIQRDFQKFTLHQMNLYFIYIIFIKIIESMLHRTLGKSQYKIERVEKKDLSKSLNESIEE